MKSPTSVLLFTLVAMFGVFLSGTNANEIRLEKGDVVAFVGGTDMVRMQKAGYFEAGLTSKFRDAKPKFRDLAWDGDTVYFQSTVRERWRKDAFGDWNAQLKRVGATVVIAQFGKIESLDGLERLGEFKKAYSGLLDTFAADGRRVILLRPDNLTWEGADRSAYADYVQAVEELSEEKKLPLADPGDFPVVKLDMRLVESVQKKHRLWYDYWRPANWKCLFGDDGKRIFSNAAEGLPSFKEEWSTFPALIAAAEEAIENGEPVKPCPAPELRGSAEADIAKELAAFEVLDGYQVNLFADESHGIANPLSVRWDADGRMFVACSDVYPQIEPGVLPDDKVIALRDTDGDGKADESEVFASGLNIPTGMEVGADGVYIGQNTELLLLRWNGTREVLLSGFGNGDSHQTSNSFAWGPAGDLWFCQGDGIESRVETPHGVSSLYQAGVFRLTPKTLKLDGLLDDFMGPGNPWGVGFDDYGQSFVIDGAGGISHLTPAAIPAKRRLRLPRIGNPGGYCGIDSIGDDEFLIGDYKKNQVTRFKVVEDGAGFKVEFQPHILRSAHRNFRPIDVKLGPDGAFYVVDWYNPITCHQDDFYRHPTRDKTHGRIWRISKKGTAAKVPGPFTKKSTDELLAELRSPNHWRRLKAKEVLSKRDLREVPAEIRTWSGRDLMEGVAMLEWTELRDQELLDALLQSDDHRARAYGARVAGRWQMFDRLEKVAEDDHPRVRMEAVLACGQIPEARSVLIAAAVAQRPRDRWIDYALSQAIHHLKPHWVPAFRRGELDFRDNGRGFATVLALADSKALIGEVRDLLIGDSLDRTARIALAKTIVAVGEEEDLKFALQIDPPSAEALGSLSDRDRPGFPVTEYLQKALEHDDPHSRSAAMSLTADWKVELHGLVSSLLKRPGSSRELQAEAIRALGKLGGEDASTELTAIAERPLAVLQAAAIVALTDIDLELAARTAGKQLAQSPSLSRKRGGEIWRGFAQKKQGGKLLAEELGKYEFSIGQLHTLENGWLGTGLVDRDITECLRKLAGDFKSPYEFGDRLIAELVAAAKNGEPEKGKMIFNTRGFCVTCHKVGESGPVIGPDLSALGSGVPPERIVTEVLWPMKHAKEGFALSKVTLKNSSILHGYEQKSRDDKLLLLRDILTSDIQELRRDEIQNVERVGNPMMPPTAQSMSERELADLFAYLFSLRG